MRVLELLGPWPAPLAIFLRTPEGQLLNPESRATIARGLGLLGSACIALGESMKGEEILRLGIQYAGDGGKPPPSSFSASVRAMLRRWPAGGGHRAASARGEPWGGSAAGLVAARRGVRFARPFACCLGAVLEARAAAAPEEELRGVVERVKQALGPALRPLGSEHRRRGRIAV